MPNTPDLTMEDLLDRTSNLKVLDEDGWEVNEDRETEVGKSCLMERFCSNKNVNRSLIRTILGRVWGSAEVDWGMKIKRVTTEATFMVFSFKNENDLKRIVNKSPWLLNNGVLLLQRYSKIPTKWEDELTRFPLSGRVLSLPTKSITRNNIMRLAGMAGFLFPSSGDRVWLPFRYERLPFMCFNCGRVGHDYRTCAMNPVKITDGEGKSSTAYGAWLKIEERPLGFREKKTQEGAYGNDLTRSRSLGKSQDGARGEDQGDEQLPRINNQNSPRKKVHVSNSPLSVEGVGLMVRKEDSQIMSEIEGEGRSRIKRRADSWDFLNLGDGVVQQSGKRVHMEGLWSAIGIEVRTIKRRGEWIDIPITFENEIGGGTSCLKGGRRKKVVAKKNKKVASKNTPQSMAIKKESGTRWRVTDGSKVRINEDHWIPRGAPFLLRTPAKVPPNTYAESLLNEVGDWKLEALEEKMNVEDIPWISGIQTMRGCGEDELIWNYTVNGDYTVASGYTLMQIDKQGVETSDKSILRKWWKEVTPLKSWTPWAIDYVDHALLQPTVNKEVKKKRGVSRWKAPLVGTFLLICDAALCTNQMGSGVVAVIRDTRGRLIVAESLFHHGCVSILLAECLAIRFGLKLVQRLNTKPFFVNSDNQTAINQLLSGKAPRADWGCRCWKFSLLIC
ncbi:hypothetical protein F8388_021837 [Cannabis sativa]|uniref:CCHC-type domain-containing protein n=1 Tax=Cannabis sativa TaxID=3483 RepID=A0A7J6E104_CANSA|nr:hypothetical protein F8388_021837 [Cannabis sativa]